MYHLPNPLHAPIEPDANARELLACCQDKLEVFDAAQILQWTFDTFGRDVAFAPSWREEDIVVHSLLEKMAVPVRGADYVHGLLLPEIWSFPEPHECVKRYFDGRKASAALWSNFHKERLCKMHEATIAVNQAWIVSTRREQYVRLENMPVLSWNERFGVFRIAPLASWQTERVRKVVQRYATDPIGVFSEQAENEPVYSDSVLSLNETSFSITQQL